MPSVKEVRSLIEHHIISSRSCRCKERQDMTFAIRRSVRSCSQTIPEALAKIWQAAGSNLRAFSYMVRKLRSIAFQRCI